MTSPASQPDAYQRAVRRFSLVSKLTAAGDMLQWDAQTQMPRGGAWARGEQMAALTEVSTDLIVAPAAADEIAGAEEMMGALEPDEKADVREMRRLWAHANAAPPELLTAKARLSSTLQTLWVEAKAENDFPKFAKPFAELAGRDPRNRRGQGRPAGHDALRRHDRRERSGGQRGADRPDLRRPRPFPAAADRRGPGAAGAVARPDPPAADPGGPADCPFDPPRGHCRP